MGFSENVQAKALVASGRCCCICHKFCGTKIALHHIRQKSYGGDDSFDNCIPLCLDCHEDMGKADPNHSTGKHYSEKELRMHRDAWYQRCSTSQYGVQEPICEDDKRLFAKINQCFSGRSGEALHYEDLRGLHRRYIFDELFTLEHELHSPFNEFVNVELEKLRAQLLDKISHFTDIYSRNTFSTDSGLPDYQVTHLWMYNNGDLPAKEVTDDEMRELYETYWREAEAINDSASELWNCYCEFYRQGRHIIAR